MKKLSLLAGMSLLALVGAARADVVLSTQLSGTGDNVIADSAGTNSALGHLNGTHLDVVDYTGIDTGFTSASHGNDIKFGNTVGLKWEVFDPTNTTEVFTTDQVFSLKGTGDVGLVVQTLESDGVTFKNTSFDLGTIGNNQSGFTLTTINGEEISTLVLLDVGGTITDFEHNRIKTVDVLAATPLPGALPMFVGGLGLLGLIKSRKRKQAASVFAVA